MIKAKVYAMIAAAALLCGCQTINIESPDTPGGTINLKASGEDYSLRFTASANWSATVGEEEGSWVKLSPTSGNAGDVILKITPSKNYEPEERSATLTISSLMNQTSFQLVQEAAKVLTVDTKEIKAGAEGGSFKIKVGHNVNFTVAPDEDYDWFTVSTTAPSKAMKDDEVEVTVLPSSYGWPRKGGITLTSSVGIEYISVYQEAAEVFSLSESSIELPFSGGPFSVEVSGKGEYHISSMPEWVSESAVDGRKHTFTAGMNESNLPRDGVIVFCDDGGVCLPLMLTQEGRPGWTASAFKHTSLVMRFTATWCGWCPVMNNSVKKAQADYPDHLLHLALHGNSSTLFFAPTGNLMTQYLISGYPTGIVDGRKEIQNSTDINAVARQIVNAAKETANTYGTVTGAAVNSTLEGSVVSMDIDLYFKETGDYKITVLLVEDNIDAAQEDYIDGAHSSYIHNGVARLAVTAIDGQSFTVDAAPSTKQMHFNATINGAWKAANVKILGYVQAKYGSRSKKRSGNYGEYYVDNSFLAVPGTELKLALE